MIRYNLPTSLFLRGSRVNTAKIRAQHVIKSVKYQNYYEHVHHKSTYTNNHWFHSQAKENKLRIKKALIVTKLTRYEFERIRHSELNDLELEELIRCRGTDFDALMHYHFLHKTLERKVYECFKNLGVETKIINRLTINRDLLRWTDIIVPVGGDGTFLLAASRASPFFIENSVPIVGFNSDPLRSEGRLMLPKQYSANVEDGVKKLLTGEFEWIHRSRIRITLLGSNGETPVPIDLHEYNTAPVEHKEVIISEPTLLDQIIGTSNANCSSTSKRKKFTKRTLPYLALNEVFIGETLSARVSHLHIRPNTTQKVTKTKSSGLCVSTGTGSTSWHTSINRLSKKNVEDLLSILKSTNSGLNDANPELISEEYNRQLVFEPDDPRLCYSIREQICIGVWPNPKGFESRDFAQNLYVKSRCIDASLVIDGSIVYPFNDGTKAFLEVLPEDALLTMKMKE
ncbi:CLUMA_CG006300, isoform A [Clunio marinus]|uniref:NAD kinase 2, mitochondrial n=1 Tax=Clunio marinus TaxID=568069 RepID=A0A1J1I3G2_9DIPT|nr:CLUMA_CG006300, isoform A [Clunio marinus]